MICMHGSGSPLLVPGVRDGIEVLAVGRASQAPMEGLLLVVLDL